MVINFNIKRPIFTRPLSLSPSLSLSLSLSVGWPAGRSVGLVVDLGSYRVGLRVARQMVDSIHGIAPAF